MQIMKLLVIQLCLFWRNFLFFNFQYFVQDAVLKIPQFCSSSIKNESKNVPNFVCDSVSFSKKR
jgi:hypothetical protein